MKIAICTPVFDKPHTAYVCSLLAVIEHVRTSRPEIELRPRLAQGHLIDTRNALAADALQWGADYILWADADTSFPNDSLTSLLDRGLSVIGCNYPTKGHPPRPTAYREQNGRFLPIYSTPEIAKAHPVEEVSHMGLGLCLIAAPLIRALGDAPFTPKPGTGSGLGEDYHLFDRLRANGAKTYLDHDLSVHVAHIGEYAYTNAVAARFSQSNHPKAVIGG